MRIPENKLDSKERASKNSHFVIPAKCSMSVSNFGNWKGGTANQGASNEDREA